MPLFIFLKAIIEANDAAAPTSKATASVIANQFGFDNLKKSITCIVDMTETITYNNTNVPIIKFRVSLFS
jgi:hypothetical protein